MAMRTTRIPLDRDHIIEMSDAPNDKEAAEEVEKPDEVEQAIIMRRTEGFHNVWGVGLTMIIAKQTGQLLTKIPTDMLCGVFDQLGPLGRRIFGATCLKLHDIYNIRFSPQERKETLARNGSKWECRGDEIVIGFTRDLDDIPEFSPWYATTNLGWLDWTADLEDYIMSNCTSLGEYVQLLREFGENVKRVGWRRSERNRWFGTEQECAFYYQQGKFDVQFEIEEIEE
ncbi:uncharacterized protein LY89DRAFT_674989 [Mollisia scopiformis]|uniref:Uncharacterized protein n=1 Tax=Mollisia scopiformis TaxID=149040 RepID=A0A194WTF2_MOLSC|nr:uncharacterized protein LY89DRAFT_674989 [Mollisia scopiformis]KUJ10887.1 hypothetical protein LY89DRAFT_674989 [Mollisia scopiformis]